MKLQSKGVAHISIQKTPDLCKSGVSVPNLSLKGTSVMHTSIGTAHAACQGVGDLTTSEAADNLGHRRPIPGVPTSFTLTPHQAGTSGTTFGTTPAQRPLRGSEN